ncbi:hypothetical protein AR457_14880 [Streptomyces agglomeratus]|uniref:Uncharacterized protein n=1 Tax=Streptomyces agglomeratus TaxID=285458 RepID=A0A1E5P7N6_9ACTN|nr:hypothetical protein [Streptomyces agglomeratus]OEJ25561.1 hypothetical protein AS594_14695 [Streptomyces agglomeratus]OEJ40401.1 hypothetical protein BGK70_21775 [Streptomyces agglomeratus]OEJ45221.1 hypothetical protein AR457_14880 [Streptomyces agglomeratus]OEJ52952.1 hypothetical protein BGK72_21415 [Streptomyces agglomeratus]OEJ60288.1 hypothetical protein BGM19_22120 [Streptomyces agglomeratus]
MSEATQRTVRTVLQTAIAIAVVLPALVESSGLARSLPWAAGAVAAAGTLSRLMALDSVQRLLPRSLRIPRRDSDLLSLLQQHRSRP